MASLACVLIAPAAAKRTDDVAVTTILAAYDNATHSADVRTFAAEGTVSGEGLTGTFSSWRDEKHERDEDSLGPRHDTTLRLGDRIYIRNSNGNVRELRGYLRRRALTEQFVDSGDFVKHPERAHFVGWGQLNGKDVWRLEVAATGGEPETLWIDPSTGLALREEYLDGDGSSYVDYADWRVVQGCTIPFRSTMSDGDHRFDTVEQTTSARIDAPIDPAVFAPLTGRTLNTDRVHTVPLIERDGHVGVTVRIADHNWFFLLDTGAQSILVDSRVLRAGGIDGAGQMEVRGAKRTGGLSVATLPSIAIDGARMDDVVVSSIDIGKNLGGSRIDGILGYPFFASALVEMDFADNVMRFGPPGSFVPRGMRLELDVDRELAEATLRLDDRIDAPFIVDTGNSGEMFLYEPFLEKHPGIVAFSNVPTWNYGLGGANAAYRTSLARLQLGGISLYNRTVDVVLAKQGAFADRVDAGNVGLGVLRNFVATFDMGGGALYLQPGAKFDDGRTVSRTATPR